MIVGALDVVDRSLVVTFTTVGPYRLRTMTGDSTTAPQDVQATFCATLVGEWVALGATIAVVAPGSRSTPMALALAASPGIDVQIVHDERSAAFIALGCGLSGTPALLLCTSGTAAANFFPAVVEAGMSDVPMIVLTADRPEELRGVGAPQTIDQVDLYGGHVRWSRDPGVPVNAERSLWRGLATEAWSHAQTGPVQLNLAFREPLIGTAGELPEREVVPPVVATSVRNDPVPDGFDQQRGVILVGGSSGVPLEQIEALHALTAWPIIADPLSGARHLAGVVTTVDALLRHQQFADDHLPATVVRVGRPATSKFLAQWIARAPMVVQVGGPGVIDPEGNVTAFCQLDSLLDAQPKGSTGTPWLARWMNAERLADLAIVNSLEADLDLNEPQVARTVADSLPDDATLTVASSMPIRDLEWFGGAAANAHANRGANGIDGVVSTALGRALSGRTSVVVVGDLAFAHDANALLGLSERSCDLRIVVVDNDGGAIFSFLPQACALAEDQFEQLFGTPLGIDVVGLACAFGIQAVTVETTADLRQQLSRPGPWLVRIPSNRASNVAVHEQLQSAVGHALGGPAGFAESGSN